MSYDRFDYWKECIETSFADHGIVATPDQMQAVASDVEGAYTNIGQAFHVPENPLRAENDDLRRKLKKESEKVGCLVCRGRGYVTEAFGPIGRSSTSRCDRCHGEGKHAP